MASCGCLGDVGQKERERGFAGATYKKRSDTSVTHIVIKNEEYFL